MWCYVICLSFAYVLYQSWLFVIYCHFCLCRTHWMFNVFLYMCKGPEACIAINPCIVLYCIVLYCIVLYCIVLYCIVLYCIVLYCIVYISYVMCSSFCYYRCKYNCVPLSTSFVLLLVNIYISILMLVPWTHCTGFVSYPSYAKYY